MKTLFCITLCVLLQAANSADKVTKPDEEEEPTCTSNNLLDSIELKSVSCPIPSGENLLDINTTVSNGLVALRFYTKGDATKGTEISLPITNNLHLDKDLPGFDFTKEVLFIFLGYKQNANSTGILEVIDAYIDNGQYNVFLIDWSGYSCKDYSSAMTECGPKSKLLQLVTEAFNQIINNGVNTKLLEVVGVGLGAQCAAALGRSFDGEVPFITGLDPAGPFFTCANGLHSGDAKFVHIIHSDRGYYGTYFLCGDFDVIINKNGFRFQPDCPCVRSDMTYTNMELCSQELALKIYAASVRGKGEFLCSNCDCYKDFKKNNCSTTPVVALHGASSSSRGHCYMRTLGKKPYGLGQEGALYSKK